MPKDDPSRHSESAIDPPAQTGERARPARLVSLDAFRGFTILLMLLVNNFGVGSATPKPLRHGGWAALHLADLVFPWFLLCVGIAIPYSMASFRRRGLPEWIHDLRALRRVLILIALGVLVSSSEAGQLVLSIGILHLIALSYGVGVVLYDLPAYRRLIIAGILLVGYWAAIRFVEVPGVGAGVLREAHNLLHHLNKTYLAAVGLEGLPLIIPTSALVLIATAIGDLTSMESISPRRKAVSLALTGAGLTAGGILWGLSVPLVKPIWTPSYVLFAAGTGTLLLAGLYVVIDILGLSKWAFPLVVYGSNAILAYVLPILFKAWILRPLDISTAGWLRVIVYSALWWLALWALYRKRLFLRV